MANANATNDHLKKNIVDYFSILGKTIDDTSIDEAEYLLEYNDLGLDEGIEPSWIVKAYDRRFEVKLSLDKAIRTIFIFPIEGRFDGFELLQRTKRAEIIKQFGIPSLSGQEIEVPILGRTGGFDRYDYKKYSIHFEYLPGDFGLKKITLMLPDTIVTKD